MRVGVYGAGRVATDTQLVWAEQLGVLLGERDHQLITGGNQGVAERAARGYATRWEPAHKATAYTAARSEEEWVEKLGGRPGSYTEARYLDSAPARIRDASLPFRYHYRNLLAADDAECAVVIGGSLGTLSSLTNLFALNKPVGLLLGSGAIADRWEEWASALTQASEGRVFGNVALSSIVSQLEKLVA